MTQRAPDAAAPRLTARRVGIDTYSENVVYLNRECGVVRAEGFQALSKIDISVNGNGRTISAVVNVVDDARIVEPGEVGLSEQAFEQLGAPEGAQVSIAHAEPPASLRFLRRKIGGERLEREQWFAIMRDIAQRRYAKIELAAFVVATSQFELDRDEVVQLTEAMIAAGRELDWRERPVVDKHCIGGIPGNRTSMLVVPIVAAHGILMPKTSSRAITSPAGTADTMEVLARVDLGFDRMSEIARSLRGCLAWGGTADLSPADDVLISVERPLAIDSPGQMVASILSKKRAAGSTHMVLDIPVGATAKVRSMAEAQRLKKLFEYVARHVGLTLEAVITDGRQPIGNGVGPVLEARDVMRVLDLDPAAPSDLRQKSLRLAGRVIEFDPDVRGGDGFSVARDILDSGRALTKMNEMIDAQGRRADPPALGALSFDVRSEQAGVVNAIDNLQIATIARLAGAPKVAGAGIDLLRKLGDPVAAGDALYRVYAGFPADLSFARRLCDRASGYSVGDAQAIPRPFVEF
ncbi:MAG: thymidine phosphorylase family protein [Burkholderiaceae bacterium]|nr:thymidine phosphorylase family protein [Burkholderiaceae bacterium]